MMFFAGQHKFFYANASLEKEIMTYRQASLACFFTSFSLLHFIFNDAT